MEIGYVGGLAQLMVGVWELHGKNGLKEGYALAAKRGGGLTFTNKGRGVTRTLWGELYYLPALPTRCILIAPSRGGHDRNPARGAPFSRKMSVLDFSSRVDSTQAS